MVGYIPPLSPVAELVHAAGYDEPAPDRIFAAIETLRVPAEYLGASSPPGTRPGLARAAVAPGNFVSDFLAWLPDLVADVGFLLAASVVINCSRAFNRRGASCSASAGASASATSAANASATRSLSSTETRDAPLGDPNAVSKRAAVVAKPRAEDSGDTPESFSMSRISSSISDSTSSSPVCLDDSTAMLIPFVCYVQVGRLRPSATRSTRRAQSLTTSETADTCGR